MLRAKTIEGIKHFFAGEMGKLLGLDRIPEYARTLRKKLDALAESGQIGAWSQALSRDWMASFQELTDRFMLTDMFMSITVPERNCRSITSPVTSYVCGEQRMMWPGLDVFNMFVSDGVQ